jgi:hypothetical protein
MTAHTLYWTFERDGEVYDAEFVSKEAAQEAADEGFAQQCEDEGGWHNGDTQEADIELIQFHYDDDSGERIIVHREESVVELEYYHGDLKEHGYPY